MKIRFEIKSFKKIFKAKRGSAAIEYGLICALVFLAFLGAVQKLGNNTDAMFNRIGNTVGTAR